MVEVNRLKSIMVLGFAALSACSPYIYRDEVKQFSDGVDQAAAAFNGLHEQMRAEHRKQELDEFADSGTPLTVSPACTGVVTEGQLVADTRCLAQWSEWRASGQTGPEPRCVGDVSPAVAAGKVEFYDLDAVQQAERERCKLGIRTPSGQVDSEPLIKAETLLVQSPRLVSALRTYADSLAAIVSSEDRDELRSSVGSAKLALNELAGRADSILGDKDRTLERSVGLAGDLVGTALLAGLDYRRFQSLKKVTEAADPTIQKSAMLLTQISMPMVAISLQDPAFVYLDKVSQFNDRPTRAAWYEAYAQAEAARDTYLTQFAISPTSVFRSMAMAHGELTRTLQDPKAQYDALRESLKEFTSKAEAAYETFTR